MAIRRSVRPTRRLTELAGLAFVEYQLARRGVEWTRTQKDSPAGDLWAMIDGTAVAIEVKATFDQPCWHVRREQCGGRFYALVHVEHGECFIITREEMQSILPRCSDAFPGTAIVPRKLLPSGSFESWATLGLTRMPSLPGERRSQPRPARSVRKKLATGEIKTYHYPAII